MCAAVSPVLEGTGSERAAPLVRSTDRVHPCGDVACGHVPGDGGTRGDERTGSDLHGPDDDCAPADERLVADDRRWFLCFGLVPGQARVELLVDEVAEDTAARPDL